ncbi:ParB N-terminal domain-containing protein [Nocardia uniformis]|uniref:ParB N-terminal domain-containing protein n=1 Tax=Nocardia uniformis TaxID=53432 RepID=A0A849C7I0_9NOCA|nr:ParB N-terminal domain-containing protein [Nocardia uniformis]NNH73726.1 ParB N-terminal domain-containing protein [Nocardia uniformis]
MTQSIETDTPNTDELEMTATDSAPTETENQPRDAASVAGGEVAVFDASALEPAEVVYDAELIEEHPEEFRTPEVDADLLEFDIPEGEARYDLDNDPELVESVRAWGVLEPVTVYPGAGGRYRVARGRRRVLAARLTGHKVPIVVRYGAAGDESETMIQTIAAEMHTNDRRIDYTDRERANRWAQMSLYGASVARIARDTSAKREEVKAALAAVDSSTAMGAVDAGQFSFEQAAVIAEYEQAGDLDAVTRLMRAPAWDFGAEAGRIAADRAQIAEQFRESLPYAERGFVFVVREPGCAGTELPDGEFIRAEELRTAEGGEVTPEVVDAAPLLWSMYLELHPESVAVDAETGEPVEFGQIDWDTRYYRSAEADEGLRHFDSVTLQDGWQPEFWLPVENLEASGLVVHEEFAPGVVVVSDTAEGVSEEDRDAAGAAAIAALEARRKAEEEREEAARKRQRVTALNIEGATAKTERRTFVAQLLTRKTLPSDAAAFIADSLLLEPDLLNRHLAQASGLDLLNLGDRDKACKHNADASANRSLVVVYGLVLGAHEARVDKSHWRAKTDGWWGDGPGYRRYLCHLAEQGHILAPVEQVTAGVLELADIDIEALCARQKAQRQEQKALAAAA